VRPVIESLSTFWSRGTLAERGGYVLGVLLVISGLIHLIILISSGGSWEGPLSLRKPTTFGLSFGLTLIAIVWVAAFLELKQRMRTVLLVIFTAACALETGLVSLQAWRGVPSHFNIETTFDAMVARALAAGGFVLVVVILVLTLAAFRANRSLPTSLRVAIRASFVALLAAQVTGAVMIATGMRLVFRGDPQAAYSAGGMLKATHEVTMLGVLMLPLLAWLASFTNWSERRRRELVLVATLGYVLLTAVVVTADVSGLSARQMPLPMIVALSIAASALVVAGGLAVVGVIHASAGSGIQHR
jgi:hypothetical protein